MMGAMYHKMITVHGENEKMAEYIFEIDGAFYNKDTGEAVMKPEFRGTLVRCKDCKHNSLNRASGNVFCDLGIGLSQIYDFCSRGERKDG